MQINLKVIFLPPLAVSRHGCAAICAAPIAVFYLAALVAIVYSSFGGPAAVPGISWSTLALGVALWAVAAAWSILVLRQNPSVTTTAQRCLRSLADEPHPLDRVQQEH